MAIKRKISYQWRLFIPVVATLWITLLSLAAWQYYRERDYRRQFITSQVEMVTKRTLSTLALHNTSELKIFLSFIDKYYVDNDVFDAIRISIFDKNWNLTDTVVSEAKSKRTRDNRGEHQPQGHSPFI